MGRTSIGELRFRLDFFTVARTPDGEGGFETNPAGLITLAGAVRAASAREIDAAGRLRQEITHVAHVRWTPTFAPTQGQVVRWIDRGGAARVAYVTAARDPDESGRFYEIGLREGGPVKGVA